VHDDVIDEATSRRGKSSVNTAFTPKECVLAGDAILAKATFMLASIGDVRVIETFAQVIFFCHFASFRHIHMRMLPTCFFFFAFAFAFAFRAAAFRHW
jgi:hypothetical protein